MLPGTLTHDQEVFILLQLAYKSVKIGKILGDFPVDQCDQKGSSDFFHTFQSFFIIVQICQGNYQLIILILLNIFLKLCLIIENIATRLMSASTFSRIRASFTTSFIVTSCMETR